MRSAAVRQLRAVMVRLAKGEVAMRVEIWCMKWKVWSIQQDDALKASLEAEMKTGKHAAAVKRLSMMMVGMMRGAKGIALQGMKLGVADERRNAEMRAMQSASEAQMRSAAVRQLRAVMVRLAKGEVAMRVEIWCTKCKTDKYVHQQQDWFRGLSSLQMVLPSLPAGVRNAIDHLSHHAAGALESALAQRDGAQRRVVQLQRDLEARAATEKVELQARAEVEEMYRQQSEVHRVQQDEWQHVTEAFEDEIQRLQAEVASCHAAASLSTRQKEKHDEEQKAARATQDAEMVEMRTDLEEAKARAEREQQMAQQMAAAQQEAEAAHKTQEVEIDRLGGELSGARLAVATMQMAAVAAAAREAQAAEEARRVAEMGAKDTEVQLLQTQQIAQEMAQIRHSQNAEMAELRAELAAARAAAERAGVMKETAIEIAEVRAELVEAKAAAKRAAIEQIERDAAERAAVMNNSHLQSPVLPEVTFMPHLSETRPATHPPVDTILNNPVARESRPRAPSATAGADVVEHLKGSAQEKTEKALSRLSRVERLSKGRSHLAGRLNRHSNGQ